MPEVKKTVTADLIQLEKVSGKYDAKKSPRRVIRKGALIEIEYLEKFNENHKANGKFYEIKKAKDEGEE